MAPSPTNDTDFLTDVETPRFLENATACEWGEDYRPGGYYPAVLGDVIAGNYQIIRKLGYGSFSTVWLVVDRNSNSYHALKIAVADSESSTISQEYEITDQLQSSTVPSTVGRGISALVAQNTFEIESVNGRHTCFVFEPMGPDLNSMLIRCPEFQYGEPWERRFTLDYAKEVLREILLALQGFHIMHVAHGDLHPRNVLATIQSLDSVPVADLQQDSSQGQPLKRLDGEADPWAPPYLLEPAPLYDYTSLTLRPLIKIADLGSAFTEKNLPDQSALPTPYRPPEVVLGLRFNETIDIWCFGCLVYELIFGQQLFQAERLEGDEYDECTNDGILVQFTEILGALPATFTALWHRKDNYFDASGNRINTWDDMTLEDREDLSFKNLEDANNYQISADDTVLPDFDSDADGRSADDGVPLFSLPPFGSLEKKIMRNKPSEMDEEEAQELASLIRWILALDPRQRPSASTILQHPFFAEGR